MIPVLILALAWWAASGVVARVKAALASDASGGTAGEDLTFGQWQRARLRRWKKRLRAAMPGTHRGSRARDLFADAAANGLAEAGLFAAGFISGAGWLAGKIVERRAARRMRNRRTGSGPRTASGTGNRRPGGRPEPDPQAPNTPPRTPNAEEVVDAELIDDPGAQPATGSGFANPEDAEVVTDPGPSPFLQITSRPAAPNGATVTPEILTIHQLFAWARDVITAAKTAVEHALIRARSASERAEQAAVRSQTATVRAEHAALAATEARDQAAQLEATAARFAGLRMDPASLASIHAAIEAARVLATAEQHRADAEANAAQAAAAHAGAEVVAATAATASARAATLYQDAVAAMHDTVRAHQSPHAEAQAATGNAAAHSSVLAAS